MRNKQQTQNFIRTLGGPTIVAKQINKIIGPDESITVSAISQWDMIPHRRLAIIAKISGRKIEELRPDLFDDSPHNKVA